MRERSVVHDWVEGAASGRQGLGSRSFWQDELGPRLVVFACAVFLLPATVMTGEFARTWWKNGGKEGTIVYDDPTGNVGLLSLCGLVALVALVAEAWSRRWAVAAALVAAAAFAYGTWVTVTYWLGFPQGERLRAGQEVLGRKSEVLFPLLLHFFTLVSVAGLACVLALVVHGWRRARSGYHTAFGGTQRGLAMTAEGVENVARRVAVGCAVLLLLGPFGGRTTWEKVRGTSSATDAGGYNAIVVVAGVAALIALGFAHWARPGPTLSLLGVAAAAVAFGLGVYATGVFVVARWQGGIWVYACWCLRTCLPAGRSPRLPARPSSRPPRSLEQWHRLALRSGG